MARGSIQKRNRNGVVSYMARVEYEPDPITGKRRQRSETFRLRKDADARRAEWLSEINRGTAIEPSKMTMSELFTAWLDGVCAHQVRPTTLSDYRWQVAKHVIPDLGSMPVQKLTAARLQVFYTAKLEQGASARTVQLCHLRLKQALAQAVKWSIVPVNVTDAVKAPTVRYRRFETWSEQELTWFLAAAEDDSLSPLWLILAMTGMRRGEGLGLRWRDVDLDRGRLTVRQGIVLLNGAPVVQDPKTSSASRTIPVDQEVVKALRAFRTRWVARKLAAPPELWEDHDLLFCTALGRPLNPNNLARKYDRILAGLNADREAKELPALRRIRIHDLRHTHATLMLKARVPIKVVSERLGHASIAITLNTYAHVLPDMQDEAVVVFSDILARARVAAS